MKTYLLIISTVFLFAYCTDRKQTTETTQQTQNKAEKKPVVVERKKPAKVVDYSYIKTNKWLQSPHDSTVIYLVATINRTDFLHLKKMDSIIVPDDTTADISYYLPFPTSVKALANIDKIIFFSYPTQAYAAYEYGEMVHTGATNMGRKKDPTPTGLFFTNWKAEQTTSTFNDEWELKWNFNIENKLGVGWHQYEMPGFPASHSCLRLQESDARKLYEWADQWVLNKDEAVQVKGTPVIVFGSYNFDRPKPWAQLVNDPLAINISETEIEQAITPHLQVITEAQNKRKSFK